MHTYPALPKVDWLIGEVSPEQAAEWRKQREKEREWNNILTLLGAPHCPLYVPPILDIPLAAWIETAFYVAIVGSREYERLGEVPLGVQTLNKTLSGRGYRLVVVSGGARGVDSLSIKACKKFGIPFIEFIPDWNTYGKRAGFLRNEQIITHTHGTVAFYDGISRGTAYSMRLTTEQGKPLLVLGPDTINCEPDCRAWVNAFDLENKLVQRSEIGRQAIDNDSRADDINAYLFG